ncbi:MAG: ATP-grasp domain-containing protein [Patescibacteria group bacterium]
MSANEFINPIMYVTRDAERASGMAPNDNYKIITNDPGIVLDTADLLEQDKVREQINGSNASILVFKNTSRIEEICKKSGWNLLNPSSALTEKYENKITQVEWLGELAKYLPTHSILLTKDLKWSGESSVIQWAHGHTGDGTLLMDSEEKLNDLRSRFPDRVARVIDYVKGPSFTVNVVVASDTILVGNISYQITGLLPFTDNPFSTVGNDWSLAHSLLNKSEISYIETMAQEIGEKMRADGWKGLFGVDVIRDNENNQIFLIEINARQPASATFESQLQKVSRGNPPLKNGVSRSETKGWGIFPEITTFEAHLLALQNKLINQGLVKINDGAQIIQRITNKTHTISDSIIKSLELAGYRVISYSNTEMNSDLLRIQSTKGIMEKHGELNNGGKEIIEKISN